MKRIRVLFRLIYINYILSRHGLDKIILSLRLFTPFHYFVYFNPKHWVRSSLTFGQEIRLALEELGPIFVKFGQALSVRRDLFPDEITKELALLQDQVPPFPEELAIKQIEETLGQKIKDIFLTFESKPLASASIAQVHSAVLLDGKNVVVKVLRPNINQQILRDIELLRILAKLANRYWKESRRFRPIEVVDEFRKTILNELDLVKEAANTSQLRKNFLGFQGLYIPKIYWEFTRESVMVSERIYGIPISDKEALFKKKVNIKKLAELGVQIFFSQVFRDCFFHADMHPGNIFVGFEDPDNPYYMAVDCGIVGTLSAKDQKYLAANFLAFFNRDYRRVAELHIESGWIPFGTRVDEFEAEVRAICEPIFGLQLKDISFAMMLTKLFQIGRNFHMEVQPQLLLFQKTLFAVEGLGRELYPQLDLWKTAKPYLEEWLKTRFSSKRTIYRIWENLPDWADQMPEMPSLIYEGMKYLREKGLSDYLARKRIAHRKKKEKRFILLPTVIAISFLLGVVTMSIIDYFLS